MTTATTRTAEAVRTWALDPAHTVVEFSVKHMMITTVRGRFRDVAGEIAFEPGATGVAAVAARLEVASIDTGVAARDEHLRSGDFFDAATHPHIEFRSRAVEGTPREAGDRFRIIGDLTIRGVTSEVVLDAAYEGMAVGAGGVELVGFTADGRIDRRVYGLNWNQALEAGGVLVGNDIRIRLEVQAAG